MAEDAHLEVADEHDKDLHDGIDDEASLDETGAPSFSITSYGADYTVDSLVKRMKSNSFIVPPFQRKFLWSQRHASKFIESLLMGLPVPGIFLYRQPDQTHLVIDGQQRLSSLRYFYEGTFQEKKFRLIGVREPWTDKSYDELALSDQLKLDDSIVHATIFQQDKPKDVLSSIYYVFERINSGGISLSPQEIRNCVNQGPLLNLIRELNNNKDWREIFGPENPRLKDQELILRFMAMMAKSDDYTRPMSNFLNDFVAVRSDASPGELSALANLFTRTIALVNKCIGQKAFRSVRALNAAVYDAVMVGLAKRILSNLTEPNEQLVSQAYNSLLMNTDFRRACERSTADEDNVKTRLALATSAFANV